VAWRVTCWQVTGGLNSFTSLVCWGFITLLMLTPSWSCYRHTWRNPGPQSSHFLFSTLSGADNRDQPMLDKTGVSCYKLGPIWNAKMQLNGHTMARCWAKCQQSKRVNTRMVQRKRVPDTSIVCYNCVRMYVELFFLCTILGIYPLDCCLSPTPCHCMSHSAAILAFQIGPSL